MNHLCPYEKWEYTVYDSDCSNSLLLLCLPVKCLWSRNGHDISQRKCLLVDTFRLPLVCDAYALPTVLAIKLEYIYIHIKKINKLPILEPFEHLGWISEGVIKRGWEDVKIWGSDCLRAYHTHMHVRIPSCICQGAHNSMHKYAYASMQI